MRAAIREILRDRHSQPPAPDPLQQLREAFAALAPNAGFLGLTAGPTTRRSRGDRLVLKDALSGRSIEICQTANELATIEILPQLIDELRRLKAAAAAPPKIQPQKARANGHTNRRAGGMRINDLPSHPAMAPSRERISATR